jgi:6,7-dimethyl-8-ribityllumazine synthase
VGVIVKDITTISGKLDATGLKVAIVAARFNDFIVNRLVDGALDYLELQGFDRADITLVRVPGAFELPLICQKLATGKKYNGILALGAVIRGSTPHFDYVCGEAVKGLAHTMLAHNVPLGFGLLTCDTIDQAIERAGSKAGNKGVEAAAAMLETIRVLEQI